MKYVNHCGMSCRPVDVCMILVPAKLNGGDLLIDIALAKVAGHNMAAAMVTLLKENVNLRSNAGNTY